MNSASIKKLETGLKCTWEFIVEPEKLANAIGSGEAQVLATPMLIAGLEQASWQAVASSLPQGFTTVGVHMDVYHTAPSPAGTKVQCEACLTSISSNGKKLHFELRASDQMGQIAYGSHERVIVEKEPFENKAARRLSSKEA